MKSAGLAVFALLLLGTVFTMDSAEPAEMDLCKPPNEYVQMSVPKKCYDDFFVCLEAEKAYCMWDNR